MNIVIETLLLIMAIVIAVRLETIAFVIQDHTRYLKKRDGRED